MADSTIENLTENESPIITDLLVINGTPNAQKISITNLISLIYPVGAIYTSIVSTNPNTLFGFGTWSAFGAGRVIVGLDSGDPDFDMVEEEGGVKTVTLTAAQSGVPAHTHAITDPGHTHDVASQSDTSPDAGTGSLASEDATNLTLDDLALSNTTGITINNNSTADASVAHTNLQPYIVVYMFKRTE